MSTTPTVTPELKALLRRVKLGRSLDTLPERLALAQTGGMGHAEFLELVLADEVTRRENTSADRRARTAGLDPTMTLDRWDDTAKITYDRAVWNELCSLRFVDAGHNAVIMRSDEHTSELQSLMRISYAVFCLKKKNKT